MSTAQDLRQAACTFPMPILASIDYSATRLFCDSYETFHNSDTDKRTFMLIVAEALDGGERDTCEWAYDDDEYFWNTQCGEAFQFTTDGPIENNFVYCCYCGGKVKEMT